MKKKLDKKTREAIIQTPREIRRLTKVIAIIGETLFDAKLKKIKRSEKDFKELYNKMERRGIA